MRRTPARGWLLLALAALASGAASHPLDEYVQASYLTLAADRLTIDLRLTPGVEVAGDVLAIVDGDRDGAISEAEGRRYAERVLRDLTLELDRRAIELSLAALALPTGAEVLKGEGTIRLQLEGAPWSEEDGAVRPGAHRLVYRNRHEPTRSAYLVNTYVPAAPFAISGQKRDFHQRGMELDYTVDGGDSPRWLWLSGVLAALAAGAVLVALKRRPPA